MTVRPADRAGDAVVRLVDVRRTYGSGRAAVTAVADCSLAVASGEVVLVTGPSGSGKTTLLNLILGWERPDAGSVHTDTDPPDWSSVAVVPQRLGLLDHLTILENVAMPGRVVPARLDLGELLASLGLGALADRFPHEASLGEQQRVAVARAMVGEPRVVVADEPTSHQDERHADLVAGRLRARADAGGAVIVASHDHRLGAIADRVLRLSDGTLHDAGFTASR